jgi:hypothetical protein
MQYHTQQPAQQPIMSEQARIDAWAARKRAEPRSRRLVGHAPQRLLRSRVSRSGLPCPEVHDTPAAAADPFPSPEVANEDDFEGFIIVDNQGRRADQIRRQMRRMRARQQMNEMEAAQADQPIY